MPEITPSFVMQYERRMKAITENSYAGRLAADTTWWNKIMRTTPIEGKSERITWLLDTAVIEPIGPTGSAGMPFESMVTQSAEYPTFKHGKGLIIQRDQLEDLDGTGLDQAAKWSDNIGNETAYYPQVLSTQLILNGSNTDGSANAYDGVPFFVGNTTSTIGGLSVVGHPYNPYNPSLGGYANWLTGAASGAYPGACPIDDVNTTPDVALYNLGKAIAYIQSVKQSNGRDPRFLRVEAIVAPPRMAPRLRELLNAKFLAQAAASGGGSGDVAALISGWGLGTPIIAHEFGSSFSYSFNQPFVQASSGNISYLPETVTGSDNTYYIICQEMRTTQLGGLLLVLRKPFKVNYYTGDSGGTAMSADLDRRDEFEYHCKGRMSAQYGHPFSIFKCSAT